MAEQTNNTATDPELEHVATLHNGCYLYRKPNGVGGYVYYSDEVGGGVFVWDSALVASTTLLAAILDEAGLQYQEAVAKGKGAE